MPATAYSPFVYDRVAHGVATWGMWGLFTLSETVVKPRLLRCDNGLHPPAPLWRFDESCPGHASSRWRHVSDITCAGAVLLPVAVAATAGLSGGGTAVLAAVGNEALLTAEASMAVNLITTLMKLATRRPRPPLIEPQTPNIEYLLSFPSGHTATAACGAAFAAVSAGLRHGPGPGLAMGVLGLAVTSLTAMGRVIGSMHYFSDVMAGTFLGTTVGFLVPWLARAR